MRTYKVGFCTCCDCQCMTQDTNGRWNSFKACLRQVDLSFENGHRIRVILCAECLESPDYQKIYDALISSDSEAGEAAINVCKKYGVPVSHKLANVQQGIRLGA